MPPSKSDTESGSSHSPCQPADPHQQHEAIKRAAADAAASRLPARYFPLGHTNPGFDIPEYLSDAEKAAAIEPPAKIRTFSDRLEQDLDDKERAKYHEFRETVVAAGWRRRRMDHAPLPRRAAVRPQEGARNAREPRRMA